MAAALGGWFIPLSVTGIGHLLSKISPGDWLPDGPPPTPDSAKVRIWAGMTPDKGTDLPGHIPGVMLYDELGKQWGSAYNKGKSLGMGDFFDYTIKGKHGNHRPSYIRLDAFNNNAICIAAVEITYPDEGKAIIYPDVAFHLCDGYIGYPSITDFPLPGVSSSGFHPYCVWLDGNDSYKKGLPRSLHFHIPDFHAHNATVDAYNANRNLLCKSQPRMGKAVDKIPLEIAVFSPPLIYNEKELDPQGKLKKTTFLDPLAVLDDHNHIWPMSEKIEPQNEMNVGMNDKVYKPPQIYGRRKAKKRGFPTKRQATQDPRWVAFTSDMASLSAEVVCGNPNALGPHYANLAQGKFCNMDDRSVWDICAGNSTTNCFDVATETLFGSKAEIIYPMVSNGTSGSPSGAVKLLQLTNRIDMLGLIDGMLST